MIKKRANSKKTMSQGAKLATLTQAIAYQGIEERKSPSSRNSTLNNLQLTRTALETYTGSIETDETLWTSLRRTVLRPRVRQFLYKSMHNSYKIGEYWKHIPNHEHRQRCRTCNTTESMTHILVHCREKPVNVIWSLARATWPHAPET